MQSRSPYLLFGQIRSRFLKTPTHRGFNDANDLFALEHLIRTKLREKEMFFPDIKVILNLNESQKIILSCL